MAFSIPQNQIQSQSLILIHRGQSHHCYQNYPLSLKIK